MRRTLTFGAVIGLLIAICAPTFAADDDLTLVRILARADITQNFVFYCAQYDPSIIERTKSRVGDAQQLMLHIRSEVVSGLPQGEAAQIVLRSANAARAGALMAVREHYGPDRAEEHARLASWCEKEVVPSVEEFINRHDHHHDLFDEAIQKAKQTAAGAAKGSQ
jgi:hypothetical protein